jgi:methionyl-tRNA formyltransferase
MTDLPFGRGGSPLQNLIAMGYSSTKLSAIDCGESLDAGAVYLKRDLSLAGTADEIMLRASDVMAEMIDALLREEPTPQPQTGAVVSFKRRSARDGNLGAAADLTTAFDYIRMLDGEGYPKAFAEIGNLRLEFSRASLKSGELLADVRITKRAGS